MTQEARQGEEFVVYGGHSWGCGNDLATAKRNFRAHGGSLSGGYAILTFPPETEFTGVDALGRYFFKRRDGKDEAPVPPTEQIIEPRKVKR